MERSFHLLPNTACVTSITDFHRPPISAWEHTERLTMYQVTAWSNVQNQLWVNFYLKIFLLVWPWVGPQFCTELTTQKKTGFNKHSTWSPGTSKSLFRLSLKNVQKGLYFWLLISLLISCYHCSDEYTLWSKKTVIQLPSLSGDFTLYSIEGKMVFLKVLLKTVYKACMFIDTKITDTQVCLVYK